MEDGWRFEGERRVCLRGSPGQRNRVPRGATSMGSRQRRSRGARVQGEDGKHPSSQAEGR